MKKNLTRLGLFLVFAGMLFFAGCIVDEEGYDVRGTWYLKYDDGMITWPVIFVGAKSNGTVYLVEISANSLVGSYTFTNYQINFTSLTVGGEAQIYHNGTVDRDSYMSGEYEVRGSRIIMGLWNATR